MEGSSRKDHLKINELVHCDICEPINTPTSGRMKYFPLFKDNHSSFEVIYCIKEKPIIWVLTKILWVDVEGNWKDHQNPQVWQMKWILQWDFFLKIEQEEYQACELTYVYIPKQNGVAKFRNKITYFWFEKNHDICYQCLSQVFKRNNSYCNVHVQNN
jgi:hypothetical protein